MSWHLLAMVVMVAVVVTLGGDLDFGSFLFGVFAVYLGQFFDQEATA